MDKSILIFGVFAVVLIGGLLFLQNPVDSAIPPTNAFANIKAGNTWINSTNYNDFLQFIAGSNVAISGNSTHHIIISATGSGGGQNNTASNLSPGTGIFAQKSGVDLEFKSLAAGNNITITSNNTSVEISASGASGESNTMSSPTHANSLVLPKSGVDLPIKGIACSGSATCSTNATDVTITVPPSTSGITSIVSTPATTAKILAFNSTSKAGLKTFNQGQGIALTNGSNAVTVATNFKLDTLSTIDIDKFISAFDNSTGDWTTKTFSVNTKDCGAQAVKSIDNSTGDVTCISIIGGTAREDTVATWETDKTWTNIGTVYVDVYLTANSNGEGMRIDTAGKTTVTLNIMWTKVGSGTQKCQIMDIVSGSVLVTGNNLASGQNTNATQTIPAGLANTIKTYKPQCLSTTGADDPVWLSGQVLLK